MDFIAALTYHVLIISTFPFTQSCPTLSPCYSQFSSPSLVVPLLPSGNLSNFLSLFFSFLFPHMKKKSGFFFNLAYFE